MAHFYPALSMFVRISLGKCFAWGTTTMLSSIFHSAFCSGHYQMGVNGFTRDNLLTLVLGKFLHPGGLLIIFKMVPKLLSEKYVPGVYKNDT